MRYLIFPLIVFWLIAGCSVSGDQHGRSVNTESDLGPQIQSTSPPAGSPVQAPADMPVQPPSASATDEPGPVIVEVSDPDKKDHEKKYDYCLSHWEMYYLTFYEAAIEIGQVDKYECEEIKIKDNDGNTIFNVKLIGDGCKLKLMVDFGQDKQDTIITFPNCIP
jgi:hypothetical protein